MTADQLREFLRENLSRECRELFGLDDPAWINRAVNNWFDDTRNYDRRWRVIEARRPKVGRVLDVAAGCGTFMLYGFRHRRDIWGIEPEAWKREFYLRKLEVCGLPAACASRMIAAVGEELPFADESFDVVSTFQTLEHVADVGRCLSEMTRVLRVGGVLYVRAPDYDCFFEPHYRVPLLPRMHKAAAERYLSALGRPTWGLRTLNWTTEREIVAALRVLRYRLRIERTRDFFIAQNRKRIERSLPRSLRALGCARLLNGVEQAKRGIRSWLRIGREERSMDLWVTKLE